MTDKLKMVEKGGKKVPFYAADGVGKMQRGGMARNPLARARRGIKKQGGLRSQAAANAGRMARQAVTAGRGRFDSYLPTIGMRDAEGGAMMRDQFQRQGQDTAQKKSRRRSGPGMFGDRRLGGMFSGNRARRGRLRPNQRAVMQGIGLRGPTGIREGGLVKIASEKSNAKTRKMERRGYGAARKP